MSGTTNRLVAALAAGLILFGTVGCSSDGSGSEAEEKPAAGDTATGGTVDDAGDRAGSGRATVVIGDETWEFDQVTCAFGEEETGVEGAVVNFSARNGSLSLYLAAEADGNYIELSDLDDLENGVNHTTMGVGAPNPVIEVVDRSISSEAGFYSYDDTGGEVGPVDGTVTATCP